MSYRRTLPRDLFNEASLLKCMGRLWILLNQTRDHAAKILEEEVDCFEIDQDQSSGAIYVASLTFQVRGTVYPLHRPLNSREPWPLWVEAPDGDDDFDSIPVFDDDGNFSDDMKQLIGIS